MRGASAGLLALAVACSGVARAEDTLPPGGWRTLDVAVLPVAAYVRASEDLFEERPEVRRLRELAGVWQRRVEARVAALDEVRLVASEQVTARIGASAAYREAVKVARDRFDLGLDLYRRLQTDEALRQLERAAALYREAYAELGEARAMADVELYRGLALAERGDVNGAHVAFRAMFMLDPTRRVAKGYYPPATERTLAGALEDSASLPDKAAARHPTARLAALASKARVGAWIIAVMEGPADAPVLRLSAYDAATRATLQLGRIPLSDEARALDLLDRAISAWHACSTVANMRPFAPRPRRKRWVVDIGYAHTILLKHEQTREGFQSPGALVTVAWLPTPGLEVFGRFIHMASLRDANRDLLDSFATSRFAVGAGLNIGSRRVRVLIRAGVEVSAVLTDIAMTTDVDCKHFGSDHPRCGRLVRYDAPAALVGPTFAAAVRWRFLDDWHLLAQIDTSSYVVHRDLVRDLNFPMTFTLGAGARF